MQKCRIIEVSDYRAVGLSTELSIITFTFRLLLLFTIYSCFIIQMHFVLQDLQLETGGRTVHAESRSCRTPSCDA